MSETYSERTVLLKHHTAKALLLAFECDNWQEVWVPRSVVYDDIDVENGSNVAEIQDWWLKQKSLY